MAPGPGGHPIRFTGPLTNLREAPVIGNGDLAALVTVAQHEIVFQLGKNDVWDARFDNIAADVVLKQDDMIRYERDYGFTWTGTWGSSPTWETKPPDVGTIYEQSPQYKSRMYSGPAPKVVGTVRLLHNGLSTTKIETTLDIARGVLTTRYEFARGSLTVEAFIARNANVLHIRASGQGVAPAYRFSVEKLPDRVDPDLPAPRVCALAASRGTITQTIPAGFDVPAFDWHLAASFPRQELNVAGQRDVEPFAYELAKNAEGKQSLSVAVATDRDGAGDSLARAIALAGCDPGADYDSALRSHEEAWRLFWSASSVELGDKPLEATWYRNLYALACHLSPHAQAPGLSANITLSDGAPWHGDYHWNLNIQKMFISSMLANHPEWRAAVEVRSRTGQPE